MPLYIKNDDSEHSLLDLMMKIDQGYSVLKSPHVGNQHPSNLVCAALGIPMAMVSFTSGERDLNFHPHLHIQGGEGTPIADIAAWTPLAVTHNGQRLEDYHQTAIRRVFPSLQVATDHELMRQEERLSTAVLRVMTHSIHRLWYRRVMPDGSLCRYKEEVVTRWDQIAHDVFGFSNQTSGWVTPNRVHILFDLTRQCLSSGRDTVYHLAGPQMVGYVAKTEKAISRAYDLLRLELRELPESLTVHIVPVASARFVELVTASSMIDAAEQVIHWYESLPPEDRRYSQERFAEVVAQFPKLIEPIEVGRFLSQYDICSASDLKLSTWMLETPLKRVQSMYQRFQKGNEAARHHLQ